MTVFCKHCGKQITDDSLYCQHCGGKQDVETTKVKNDKRNNESKIDIEKSLSYLLSERKKKYLILYAIWTMFHIVLWMYGKDGHESYRQHDVLFPFGNENYYNSSFNASYYDGTEFLIYVFLLPLIIYFYFKYWHDPLMIWIKEWKKK